MAQYRHSGWLQAPNTGSNPSLAAGCAGETLRVGCCACTDRRGHLMLAPEACADGGRGDGRCGEGGGRVGWR